MKLSSSQKKFFHTNERWISLSLSDKNNDPDSKHDEFDSSKILITSHKKPKDQTYRRCIEYWDDIKQKYKFNHLYRKRVLKVKQEKLQDIINDKTKITQLLVEEGAVQAQYVNKSKNIDVRGEGVWKQLNGNHIETPKDTPRTPSLVETSCSDTEVDIVEDLKKCFVDESNKTELDTIDSNEAPKGPILEQEIHKPCGHVSKKLKKLFTVPECLEVESSKDSLPIEYPTEFELCMKQMHDLGVPEIKEDIKSEETPSEEDPWCKLQKCQFEKYGFTDLSYCLDNKDGPEGEASEEDFYEKIINKIMEKDLRIKGTKIKIKQALGEENCEDIRANFRQAGVTVIGKDGKYLQGIDLREEKDVEEEEVKIMKQVLETLVGEWKTMGDFLRELADHSSSPIKEPPALQKPPILKRSLGPLGRNVLKMVSDITEEDQVGETTRDLNFEVKYDCNQPKSYSQSPFFSKEQQEKKNCISYREKIDFKIQKDKKGNKVLSKQKAIKKEFLSLGSQDVKRYASTTEKQTNVTNQECLCEKLGAEKTPSEDFDANEPQLNHRGLVELLSGSKYAGSWNRLGMEGCGMYISPGGTAIEGHMSDGVLNGPASVYLPNGMVIAGAFDKGRFHSPKIQFGDGIEYKNKDWDYLKETKKLNKSKIRLSKPILDRDIPPGCYDTGEGFYNPQTKLIYHPITNSPIRAVSEREEKWIISVCRSGTPKCVSLDEHLYETVDIPPTKDNKKNYEFLYEGEPWNDCCSPYYNLPNEEDSKEVKISPDRLIQIDAKSRPVKELWDNVRSLTGAQKARIGVPFSYERVIHYTCYDGLRLLKLIGNNTSQIKINE